MLFRPYIAGGAVHLESTEEAVGTIAVDVLHVKEGGCVGETSVGGMVGLVCGPLVDARGHAMGLEYLAALVPASD